MCASVALKDCVQFLLLLCEGGVTFDSQHLSLAQCCWLDSVCLLFFAVNDVNAALGACQTRVFAFSPSL